MRLLGLACLCLAGCGGGATNIREMIVHGPSNVTVLTESGGGVSWRNLSDTFQRGDLVWHRDLPEGLLPWFSESGDFTKRYHLHVPPDFEIPRPDTHGMQERHYAFQKQEGKLVVCRK